MQSRQRTACRVCEAQNPRGHEGNLQGGKAAAVVNRMLQKKELPKLSEGFSRITICQSERDVEDAISTYSKLRAHDILPSGCFAQKSPDAKVQSGILKFFKKVDPPTLGSCSSGMGSSSSSPSSAKETQFCDGGSKSNYSRSVSVVGEKGDHMEVDSVSDTATLAKPVTVSCSSDIAATLAFPSISTADFQFDHDKASDIIVEKVEEYLRKLRNVKLVLVDLTHKSKILSLVKVKAAKRNISPEKFFTFVGDITCLYTKGGLRCRAIANAANWRLKPGGGGVNAAIYNAAGASLETATKERANSLTPGKAVVIPLPANSPLFIKEGVKHVIHVLGPNMNPQRPNCLKNNYDEGCEILREAYSSLFEGFASIVETDLLETKGNNGENHSKSELSNHGAQRDDNASELKMKREIGFGEERSKKYKGLKYEVGSGNNNMGNSKEQHEKLKKHVSTSKSWGSWAQALYNIAMNPEKHKDDVLEMTTDVVVLNDAYPKAKRHILVLARLDHLDSLEDVRQEHLKLLTTMHQVGMKWIERFLAEDESLCFRLGFHSVPSMRQLHLHVISQDFNSLHLKNKKHWNSFNTDFFRDAVDVIEEVEKYGKPSIQDDKLLSKELRCHRCKSAHPNIPRLKSHISNCQAPFPATLLLKGRLVWGANKTDASS
ncbi:transcription factor bHLH140 isoform X2 [Amaranthus tricolor]|uniref:transcription factor bHLH140 isoform X2 n=1 Tax=Amaranthus tricolor TaxID=29722 RepID=UPI00258E99B2|nr:transcription factor bHLH140 isoform X2 [Amaranthus tricolor]